MDTKWLSKPAINPFGFVGVGGCQWGNNGDRGGSTLAGECGNIERSDRAQVSVLRRRSDDGNDDTLVYEWASDGLDGAASERVDGSVSEWVHE